jgi:hypothetical protein
MALLAASGRRCLLLAAASGLLFGLSYYTKPEGVMAGLVLYALTIAFSKDHRKASVLFAFPAILALAIFPYLLYVHRETGQLMLSNKQNIVFQLSVARMFPSLEIKESFGFLSFIAGYPLLALRKLLSGIGRIVWNLPEAFYRINLFFFIIVLFARTAATPRRRIIWSFVGIFFLGIAFYNPEYRYCIPFMPLLASDVATGFLIFRKWLSAKTGRESSVPLAAFILLVSFLSGMPRKDILKEGIRETGMALKGQADGALIASNDVRFAFYAEGEHLPLEDFARQMDPKGAALPDILILHETEDRDVLARMADWRKERSSLPYERKISFNGENFYLFSEKELMFFPCR